MPKTETHKKTPEIFVRFFGGFQVVINGQVINESSSRARRPWSLLQYLMVYRNKSVSRQQLIEALWPDGTSEQPDKALKNLVYRVRSAFAAKNVPFAQDVVQYVNGNYQLNNSLLWKIDFEQFDSLCEQAVKPGQPPQVGIDCGRSAIELYGGDFLAEQIYEDWVLPFNTHYRSGFFRMVGMVLDLLEQQGADAEIEAVCSHALAIDQFEEELHLAYMGALVRQDKKSTALAHYNKMADIFFREMGVTPCDELREMYKDLGNALNRTETDLASIKEAMAETDVTNDAFYCDFEVFRNLYRLEARAAERAGEAVFVGLLTLTDVRGELCEGERLNRDMAELLEVVHSSLRRGDVVSRFSLTQYILMLPTITVENAEMVMGRLTERFRRRASDGSVRLEAKVQPLSPVLI